MIPVLTIFDHECHHHPFWSQNYRQDVCVAAVRRSVKIALLQQTQEQEFSELVEELLVEWLSIQKTDNSNI